MTSASDKGITIWQMLMRRFFGDAEPASPAPETPVRIKPTLFNPLRFTVGGYVRVESQGLDAMTFAVETMEEYSREIGKTKLVFTDYALHDPNVDVWVTLRIIPKDGGGFHCLLLRPHWEEGFSKDLEADIRGGTYVDEEKGITYKALGNFKASVREISADGVTRRDVEYWDFISETDEQLFYVVEMDLSDREGWIQAYRGTTFAFEDVKPIAGHTSAAA